MRGKGFTLVELLITISILAILMTIALISYGNIQKGARDARRKSDLSNIQSALEQYHADQGFYPLSITTGSSLTNGASKTYLSKIPKETNPSPYPDYSYIKSPSSCTNVDVTNYCTNYCLYATVENSSNAVSASNCSASASQYQTQAP